MQIKLLAKICQEETKSQPNGLIPKVRVLLITLLVDKKNPGVRDTLI